MRQVGSHSDEHAARRFAAYLVTQGIDALAEQDGDEWAIWVRDENRIEEARKLFSKFRMDPTSERYQNVEREAEVIQREEARRRADAQKNVVEMRGKWKSPGTRRAPLTMTMIVLSVVVTLASDFGQAKQGVGATIDRKLSFCEKPTFIASGGDPLASLAAGGFWRLVTPIFRHLDWIHLAFNMIMFYQFGGIVESLRGTVRFALMVLLIAVLSNLAQAVFPNSLGGNPFFGGMSGVVYGLFGYVWLKSVFDPEPGVRLSQVTVIILMGWLFLCMTGAMGPIANVAHVVGLIVGMVMGYLPTWWKK